MNTDGSENRIKLQRLAHDAMVEKGLIPDFPAEVINEINNIKLKSSFDNDSSVKDLRDLLWCSIDNDDSKDLDQLSVAISMQSNLTRILVAIADVDSMVKKGSAIDKYASHNTTSVYTSAKIFPMLPEKLSTDLTSLGYGVERRAIIFDMTISDDGNIHNSDIYRALVINKAKLAYNSVSAWLDGDGDIPVDIVKVDGLAENIKLQYKVAKKLREIRNQNGALDFETIRSKPVFSGDKLEDIQIEKSNSSKDLIEDLMIAANGVSARYLAAKNLPSIRRIVRKPKRWERIVQLASEKGYKLPDEPDSKALEEFLKISRLKETESFPELSLSIIKLLGAGEYTIELPGEKPTGHFGLAVKDYSHSTAPNRRYPDLLTQRLLKSAILGSELPYTVEELQNLVEHCTNAENAAKKVERQIEKSTNILLLESKIGEIFEAIVTGSNNKGIWIKIKNPPVEGKLVNTDKKVDVGDKLKVKLIHTDFEHGFIDFSV